MKVAISINHLTHQKEHGQAIKEGLEIHGMQTVFTPGDTVVPDVDFHVTWSIKRTEIIKWSQQHGRPFLVMERGYVGDRMAYTSMGWNGLGRRGIYAKAQDGGERWKKNWSHLMKPWKEPVGRTVLICGQVQGDSSLYGLPGGFPRWAQLYTNVAVDLGYTVLFRPHPATVSQGLTFRPEGATRTKGVLLSDDLKMTDLVLTYNSTSGVEAVLAGVPTITKDEGAMAWDVTSHDLDEDYVCPDRRPWAHELAWTQFSLHEIRSGFAWEAVSQALEVTS